MFTLLGRGLQVVNVKPMKQLTVDVIILGEAVNQFENRLDMNFYNVSSQDFNFKKNHDDHTSSFYITGKITYPIMMC